MAVVLHPPDYTLANFDSLKLVTITVTRKMFSMVLSVLIYGHHLTSRQFMGVGLVFTAIGAEAVLESKEKAAKKRLAADKERAKMLGLNGNGKRGKES